MPRKPRCDSPIRVLNIGQKGHNGQVIFYEPEDYSYYLQCLRKACKDNDMVLLAFALMANHIHAIFYGEIAKCANIFQSVGASYVKWFNQKYARSGTLWNSRYYSKPIMDEQQMLQTVAYIFNNPVKAGMVKEPERYRWSSLKALESREFDAEACQILDQYLGIDNVIKYTKKVAHEPMDSSVKKVCEVIPKKKLSDLQAIDIVKKMVNKKNLGRVPSLSKKLLRRLVKKLLKMGSNISQISRITGMNRRLVVSLM